MGLLDQAQQPRVLDGPHRTPAAVALVVANADTPRVLQLGLDPEGSRYRSMNALTSFA
jgi:hypothetical protein